MQQPEDLQNLQVISALADIRKKERKNKFTTARKGGLSIYISDRDAPTSKRSVKMLFIVHIAITYFILNGKEYG